MDYCVFTVSFRFFCHHTATTKIHHVVYTLLPHDSIPLCLRARRVGTARRHRRVHSHPAQQGVVGMRLGLAIAPVATPGDRQRNRRRIAVGDEMRRHHRSEEHTSELKSLMRISYAVLCMKKKK